MLPDITTRKVAIPAALFLALSPGLLLKTDGSKITYMNQTTDQMSVFFHALVFFLVYSLVAKALGLVLTLPPGSGGVYMSGQTSIESMMTHTVVFAVVFALLRRQFPQFY